MTGARQGEAAPGREFVTAFAEAASQVIGTVASADLRARVPACPDWSTYDLIVHLGNVHAWAATIVETGSRAPYQDDHPRSQRPRPAAEWYAGKAEDLLRVFDEADLAEDCWTFAPKDRTKGFWPRRQAHETLIHLVDLHQSQGTPFDLPVPLAADGVAEVLEVFVPRMHRRGEPTDLTAPLVLLLSDSDDAWTLLPRPDGPPEVVPGIDEEGSSGDLPDLVEAPAVDLVQVLWKRLPYDHPSVRFGGDLGRVTRFLQSPLTP